jgi:hypothetical protein
MLFNVFGKVKKGNLIENKINDFPLRYQKIKVIETG